eukprot:TRINITY_DN7252_c0_g1_i1.p1 TRINITY_DN7252_c0_g1~~TRINITY_DN7252_c0_g1_i1.p1  ORF type:complete len:195 (-),score=43.31 TRINITY_DN7252_c0_g1_i1:272-856(-)
MSIPNQFYPKKDQKIFTSSQPTKSRYRKKTQSKQSLKYYSQRIRPFDLRPDIFSLDKTNDDQLNDVLKGFCMKDYFVNVVGVIGKSFYGKDDFVYGGVLERRFFINKDGRNECAIDLYNDATNSTIYLVLVSLDDYFLFSNIFKGLDDLDESKIHLIMEKQEYHHLKALLFIFLSSHYVLVCHSNHVLNLKYLK